jgi:hypothetical protein
MPTYVIEPDVVARAMMCHRNHGCVQEEGAFRFCQLEPAAEGAVLFIRDPSENGCRYKVPFGDRAFCGCPVRQAIFDKYQV